MKIGESKLSRNMTAVPKPVRVALNLESGDVIEWYIEGDEIIVKKKIREG